MLESREKKRTSFKRMNVLQLDFFNEASTLARVWVYTRYQDFNPAGFQFFWKIVQAICVMLKNISTQSFTWICAHWIWTTDLGRWKLFFTRIWPISLYYIRYRFFHSSQSPTISHLKAFSSDLCWHGLCETMALVWPFPQPSFPIQWWDTISPNKDYSSSSCKTALILHF